ncbi:MAG: DUF2846 domain-containing protein [Burkholderiales bacterium]|nr:DUF2846 domain-containing protein [Burkholderiales bacterium]
MSKNAFRVWTLLASLLILAGCASGPKFNTVEASMPALAKDKARVFFYRATSLGAAIQPDVRMNGTVIGKAVPLGVYFADTDPGNIEIATSTEVERKLTFSIGASETRYVRLNISLGLLVGRVAPELVDEKEARMEIVDLAFLPNRGLEGAK